MPHAVQLVEGNMDPLEARLVIHGHVWEAGPIVSGPLPREALVDAIDQMVSDYVTDLGRAARIYRGPATIRFVVEPTGSVAATTLILDRVKRLRRLGPSVTEMLAGLVARIAQLHFQPTTTDTTVIAPFVFE